jgi:hypothetical protein
MLLRAVEILSVLLVLAVGVMVWQAARGVRVWSRLRGDRIVTCTATGYPAAVRIDALGAAVDALIFREANGGIADCSLRAAGGPCDQGCAAEAVAPSSTTESIAARWYRSKVCVCCAAPIVARSAGHSAALLSPRGATREWAEVPAARLPAALRTDLPVCWNCHVSATLRREHPYLVTDRPWPKHPGTRAG